MPEPKKTIPEVNTRGMIREGSPEGGPSVRFDPHVRANFHLDGNGNRVYHAKPDGFRFDDEGTLHPLKGTEEGEPAAVPADANSGVPADKEN